MATYVATLDGQDVDLKLETLRITDVINGVSTLSAQIIVEGGSYRPALRTLFTLTEDGTTIFAGILHTFHEIGTDGPAVDDTLITIEVKDYARYAEQVTVTSPAGSYTVKDWLETYAEPELTGFGLSLDPAQPTGPTIDIPEYEDRPLSSILPEIADLAAEADDEAYFSKFQPAAIFGIYTLGDLAAPADLIEGDALECGDVSVERTHDHYADVVRMRFGPNGIAPIFPTWVGDGSTTVFSVAPLNVVSYVHMQINGVGGETISPPGLGGQWEFDPSTKEFTRVIGAPGLGDTIALHTANGQFPVTVSVGTGAIKITLRDESIVDAATATSIITRELAKRQQAYVTVRYPTRTLGFAAGQTQAIQTAKRGLSSSIDCVLKEVTTSWDQGNTGLVRSLVCSKDGLDLRSLLDNGAGASSSLTTIAAQPAPYAIGQTTPAGADKDVQFNNGGAFGADTGYFDYDKSAHALAVDTIAAHAGDDLALSGGVSSNPNRGDVIVTGGDGIANGYHGGKVTITGGSTSASGAIGGNVEIVGGSANGGGVAQTPGVVTIKSGDSSVTTGTVSVGTGVTITTGSFPASCPMLGTQIAISVATPPTNTGGTGTGVTGGAVSISAGVGQADAFSALSNGTAGDGGPLTLAAGAGGAETQAGNTRTGGNGGAVNITAGNGGNAPGAGGTTNNGGNGGDIILTPGAGGTGSTATGAIGKVRVVSSYIELDEITAPAAPASNKVRLYAQDNGGGKTQLMAIFSSGAAQQVAIQP